MQYGPTAYVYPTQGQRLNEEGSHSDVPGRVDLVLTYPAPNKKNGERTFTFEGRTSKQLRKVMALMRHSARGLQTGNDHAAEFVR